MRSWLIIIGLTFAVLIAVWLQVGLLGLWPFLAAGCNLVVVAILLIALFRSWTAAAWLSVVAGALLGQYGIWPLAYPIAFLGMVFGTWLMLQRWLATRSATSLLAAAAVATMMFHLLSALMGAVLQTTSSSTIGPDWSSTIRVMIVQSIIHPILLYFFWRRLRGGSFAKTTDQQSF